MNTCKQTLNEYFEWINACILESGVTVYHMFYRWWIAITSMSLVEQFSVFLPEQSWRSRFDALWFLQLLQCPLIFDHEQRFCSLNPPSNSWSSFGKHKLSNLLFADNYLSSFSNNSSDLIDWNDNSSFYSQVTTTLHFSSTFFATVSSFIGVIIPTLLFAHLLLAKIILTKIRKCLAQKQSQNQNPLIFIQITDESSGMTGNLWDTVAAEKLFYPKKVRENFLLVDAGLDISSI